VFETVKKMPKEQNKSTHNTSKSENATMRVIPFSKKETPPLFPPRQNREETKIAHIPTGKVNKVL